MHKAVFLAFLCSLTCSAYAERADWAPVGFQAELGCDEILSGNDRKAVYGWEVVFREFARGFEPVLEGSLSGREAVFLGAGVAWRREAEGPLTVRFGVAPGFYERGEGKDLGGHFQIQSFVELAVRVADAQRVGVRLAHLSNASLNDTNPGTEILGLTYSVRWR